jgi:hypothetical protein
MMDIRLTKPEALFLVKKCNKEIAKRKAEGTPIIFYVRLRDKLVEYARQLD